MSRSHDSDVELQFALEASFGRESGEDLDAKIDVDERYAKMVQNRWREQASHEAAPRGGRAGGRSGRKPLPEGREEAQLSLVGAVLCFGLGCVGYGGYLPGIVVLLCFLGFLGFLSVIAVLASAKYAAAFTLRCPKRNGAKVVPVLIFHLLLLSAIAIIAFIVIAKNDPALWNEY